MPKLTKVPAAVPFLCSRKAVRFLTEQRQRRECLDCALNSTKYDSSKIRAVEVIDDMMFLEHSPCAHYLPISRSDE